MSLHLPSGILRRPAGSSSTTNVFSSLSTLSSQTPPRRNLRAFLVSLPSRRHVSFLKWLGSDRGKSSRPPPLDPLAKDFLAKKPAANSLPASDMPAKGDLAPDSIFSTLPEASAAKKQQPPGGDGGDQAVQPATAAPGQAAVARRLDPTLAAAKLDPHPIARRRWERKMVIRSVRQRGRISRSTKILRTEREHVSKSPMIPTSVKKLGPLARQIAGKSIEDAITQMRFSKKLAAAEVLKQLELARDEAVVVRGMGLGKVNTTTDGEKEEANTQAEKIVYSNKKGKKVVVHDPTAIYVDQAWVGRGKYGTDYDFRARGRVNLLRPPLTSISIKLKEEATRVRIAREREAKRAAKKPWVQHPDRPVTSQRQYVMW